MLDELARGEGRGLGAAAEAPVVQHLRDLLADGGPRVCPVLGDVEPLAAVRGGAPGCSDGGVEDEVQVGHWGSRAQCPALCVHTGGRTVVDVDVVPHGRAPADHPALLARKRGPDERRDLHRVGVLDPGCGQDGRGDAVDGAGEDDVRPDVA